MNQTFNKLHTEYQQAKNNNDTQKQKEILEKMRENLKERVMNNTSYTCSTDIDGATFEGLLKIDGELNLVASSQKMTQDADRAREEQLNKNRYRP